MERRTPEGTHLSLVYPDVLEGEYELCPLPGGRVAATATVVGGAGQPDRLAGLSRRARAPQEGRCEPAVASSLALAGGGGGQTAVERECPGEDGDEQDGDAQAGDDDGPDTVLPAVEEGVGVPAGRAGR